MLHAAAAQQPTLYLVARSSWAHELVGPGTHASWLAASLRFGDPKLAGPWARGFVLVGCLPVSDLVDRSICSRNRFGPFEELLFLLCYIRSQVLR